MYDLCEFFFFFFVISDCHSFFSRYYKMNNYILAITLYTCSMLWTAFCKTRNVDIGWPGNMIIDSKNFHFRCRLSYLDSPGFFALP